MQNSSSNITILRLAQSVYSTLLPSQKEKGIDLLANSNVQELWINRLSVTSVRMLANGFYHVELNRLNPSEDFHQLCHLVMDFPRNWDALFDIPVQDDDVQQQQQPISFATWAQRSENKVNLQLLPLPIMPSDDEWVALEKSRGLLFREVKVFQYLLQSLWSDFELDQSWYHLFSTGIRIQPKLGNYKSIDVEKARRFIQVYHGTVSVIEAGIPNVLTPKQPHFQQIQQEIFNCIQKHRLEMTEWKRLLEMNPLPSMTVWMDAAKKFLMGYLEKDMIKGDQDRMEETTTCLERCKNLWAVIREVEKTFKHPQVIFQEQIRRIELEKNNMVALNQKIQSKLVEWFRKPFRVIRNDPHSLDAMEDQEDDDEEEEEEEGVAGSSAESTTITRLVIQVDELKLARERMLKNKQLPCKVLDVTNIEDLDYNFYLRTCFHCGPQIRLKLERRQFLIKDYRNSSQVEEWVRTKEGSFALVFEKGVIQHATKENILNNLVFCFAPSFEDRIKMEDTLNQQLLSNPLGLEEFAFKLKYQTLLGQIVQENRFGIFISIKDIALYRDKDKILTKWIIEDWRMIFIEGDDSFDVNSRAKFVNSEGRMVNTREDAVFQILFRSMDYFQWQSALRQNQYLFDHAQDADTIINYFGKSEAEVQQLLLSKKEIALLEKAKKDKDRALADQREFWVRTSVQMISHVGYHIVNNRYTMQILPGIDHQRAVDEFQFPHQDIALALDKGRVIPMTAENHHWFRVLEFVPNGLDVAERTRVLQQRFDSQQLEEDAFLNAVEQERVAKMVAPVGDTKNQFVVLKTDPKWERMSRMLGTLEVGQRLSDWRLVFSSLKEYQLAQEKKLNFVGKNGQCSGKEEKDAWFEMFPGELEVDDGGMELEGEAMIEALRTKANRVEVSNTDNAEFYIRTSFELARYVGYQVATGDRRYKSNVYSTEGARKKEEYLANPKPDCWAVVMNETYSLVPADKATHMWSRMIEYYPTQSQMQAGIVSLTEEWSAFKSSSNPLLLEDQRITFENEKERERVANWVSTDRTAFKRLFVVLKNIPKMDRMGRSLGGLKEGELVTDGRWLVFGPSVQLVEGAFLYLTVAGTLTNELREAAMEIFPLTPTLDREQSSKDQLEYLRQFHHHPTPTKTDANSLDEFRVRTNKELWPHIGYKLSAAGKYQSFPNPPNGARLKEEFLKKPLDALHPDPPAFVLVDGKVQLATKELIMFSRVAWFSGDLNQPLDVSTLQKEFDDSGMTETDFVTQKERERTKEWLLAGYDGPLTDYSGYFAVVLKNLPKVERLGRQLGPLKEGEELPDWVWLLDMSAVNVTKYSYLGLGGQWTTELREAVVEIFPVGYQKPDNSMLSAPDKLEEYRTQANRKTSPAENKKKVDEWLQRTLFSLRLVVGVDLSVDNRYIPVIKGPTHQQLVTQVLQTERESFAVILVQGKVVQATLDNHSYYRVLEYFQNQHDMNEGIVLLQRVYDALPVEKKATMELDREKSRIQTGLTLEMYKESKVEPTFTPEQETLLLRWNGLNQERIPNPEFVLFEKSLMLSKPYRYMVRKPIPKWIRQSRFLGSLKEGDFLEDWRLVVEDVSQYAFLESYSWLNLNGQVTPEQKEAVFEFIPAEVWGVEGAMMDVEGETSKARAKRVLDYLYSKEKAPVPPVPLKKGPEEFMRRTYWGLEQLVGYKHSTNGQFISNPICTPDQVNLVLKDKTPADCFAVILVNGQMQQATEENHMYHKIVQYFQTQLELDQALPTLQADFSNSNLSMENYLIQLDRFRVISWVDSTTNGTIGGGGIYVFLKAGMLERRNRDLGTYKRGDFVGDWRMVVNSLPDLQGFTATRYVDKDGKPTAIRDDAWIEYCADEFSSLKLRNRILFEDHPKEMKEYVIRTSWTLRRQVANEENASSHEYTYTTDSVNSTRAVEEYLQRMNFTDNFALILDMGTEQILAATLENIRYSMVFGHSRTAQEQANKIQQFQRLYDESPKKRLVFVEDVIHKEFSLACAEDLQSSQIYGLFIGLKDETGYKNGRIGKITAGSGYLNCREILEQTQADRLLEPGYVFVQMNGKVTDQEDSQTLFQVFGVTRDRQEFLDYVTQTKQVWASKNMSADQKRAKLGGGEREQKRLKGGE